MASATRQVQEVETKKRGRTPEADGVLSERATKKPKPTPEDSMTSASAINSLPDEILTDILLRLDDPFISQLKTVCKSWFTLLTSRAFIIASHLRSQTIRLNRPTLIFHDTHSFYSLDNTTEPRKIVCPFVSPDDYAVSVLGSCNGIFLIGAYLRSQGPWGPADHKKVFDVLHLWNPNTNESVNIPETFSKIPEGRTDCHKAVYGLGYDSSKDDYKVIRMLYYYDNNVPERDIHNDFQSDVHIYSLRSNSAKRIKDVPYLIHNTTRLPQGIVSGVFCNGAIHWLGYDNMAMRSSTRTNEVIVCFDVATEQFTQPMQLSFLKHASRLELNEMQRTGLGLYNHRQGYTHMYTMKEYGVEKSWKRMPPIKHPDSPQQSPSPVCTVITSTKTHLLVQWRYKDLLWYKKPPHGGNNEYTKDDSKHGFDQVPEGSKQLFQVLIYLSSLAKEQFHALIYFCTLVSLNQIQGYRHSSV